MERSGENRGRWGGNGEVLLASVTTVVSLILGLGGLGAVMNYLTTLPLSDLKPPAPTPSCTTHCPNLLYSPSPHLSSSFLKIPLHLLLPGQRYLLRLIVM